MTREHWFDGPEGRIHALQMGEGERLLIALHGFSERAQAYEPLHPVFFKEYTLIALDLPFHGRSEWRQDVFTPEMLSGVISRIADNFGRQRFALAGFSFGARLALGMLPLLAERLEALYLLSPDGIYTKGLRLADSVPPGLRSWIQRRWRHPRLLMSLPMPAAYRQFLQKNLAHPQRTQRALACWRSMYYFRIRREQVLGQALKHRLPMRVYAAAQDDILHIPALKRYFSGFPDLEMHILDGVGHGLV